MHGKKILGTEKRLAGREEVYQKAQMKWYPERIDISKAVVSKVQQCIVTMVQDTVWTSGAISRWNGSICFLGNTTAHLCGKGRLQLVSVNVITGKLCGIDEWRVLPP